MAAFGSGCVPGPLVSSSLPRFNAPPARASRNLVTHRGSTRDVMRVLGAGRGGCESCCAVPAAECNVTWPSIIRTCGRHSVAPLCIHRGHHHPRLRGAGAPRRALRPCLITCLARRGPGRPGPTIAGGVVQAPCAGTAGAPPRMVCCVGGHRPPSLHLFCLAAARPGAAPRTTGRPSTAARPCPPPPARLPTSVPGCTGSAMAWQATLM